MIATALVASLLVGVAAADQRRAVRGARRPWGDPVWSGCGVLAALVGMAGAVHSGAEPLPAAAIMALAAAAMAGGADRLGPSGPSLAV